MHMYVQGLSGVGCTTSSRKTPAPMARLPLEGRLSSGGLSDAHRWYIPATQPGRWRCQCSCWLLHVASRANECLALFFVLLKCVVEVLIRAKDGLGTAMAPKENNEAINLLSLGKSQCSLIFARTHN
jgi:hypothetical protein